MIDFEASIRSFWEQNDRWQWMLAAAVALLLLFLTTGLRRWIRSRHRALAATTHVELTEVPFEVANKTSGAFLLTLSLFAALSTLTLPPALWRGTTTAFTVVGFLQLGVWGSAADSSLGRGTAEGSRHGGSGSGGQPRHRRLLTPHRGLEPDRAADPR